MPKPASSAFPPRDLWLPVIPFLPLVILTVSLSWLIVAGDRLDFLKSGELKYIDEVNRNWVHLADMLVYYSFGSFHVLICFIVIFYFVSSIRQLPPRDSRKSRIFLGLILALLGGMIVYFTGYASDIVLVQLGYKAVCLALQNADLATQLLVGMNLDTGNVEAACFRVVFNKLTLLMWIPAFSGMATVGFAAAFAYGNAAAMPAVDDPQWRSVVERRIKALQRSVYALSVVLVSSTVTITLFTHLPTRLLSDDGGHAAAVSAYAVAISTFWGALFSLTLLATFAVPALRILRQAYGGQDAVRGAAGPTRELQEWLHEHVFVSVRKQAVNVFSLLAPLMVGPISGLLSDLAGM